MFYCRSCPQRIYTQWHPLFNQSNFRKTNLIVNSLSIPAGGSRLLQVEKLLHSCSINLQKLAKIEDSLGRTISFNRLILLSLLILDFPLFPLSNVSLTFVLDWGILLYLLPSRLSDPNNFQDIMFPSLL